jgi:Cu(I)/Ag(I) efflux system protein CusF
MKTLAVIFFSALSLSTVSAFADDMAGMAGMSNMPGMATASDTSATPVYHSQGVIKQWDGQHASIAHNAVPELNWPAMTMTYALPASLAAQNLAPGTQVTFSFHQDAQGYTLTAISPVQP